MPMSQKRESERRGQHTGRDKSQAPMNGMSFVVEKSYDQRTDESTRLADGVDQAESGSGRCFGEDDGRHSPDARKRRGGEPVEERK